MDYDPDEDNVTSYKKALIIVDMQNDFCEGYTDSEGIAQPNGSLAVGGSLELVAIINTLRE